MKLNIGELIGKYFPVLVKRGQQYRALFMKTFTLFCSHFEHSSKKTFFGVENISNKCYREEGNTFYPQCIIP
jgi:hypothetical protein